MKQLSPKSPSSAICKMWSAIYSASKITGDLNDFAQNETFAWFLFNYLKFKRNYLWYLCEQKIGRPHFENGRIIGPFCDNCFLKKYCKNQVANVECRKLFLRSKTTWKYKSINIIHGYLGYVCIEAITHLTCYYNLVCLN